MASSSRMFPFRFWEPWSDSLPPADYIPPEPVDFDDFVEHYKDYLERIGVIPEWECRLRQWGKIQAFLDEDEINLFDRTPLNTNRSILLDDRSILLDDQRSRGVRSPSSTQFRSSARTMSP